MTITAKCFNQDKWHLLSVWHQSMKTTLNLNMVSPILLYMAKEDSHLVKVSWLLAICLQMCIKVLMETDLQPICQLDFHLPITNLLFTKSLIQWVVQILISKPVQFTLQLVSPVQAITMLAILQLTKHQDTLVQVLCIHLLDLKDRYLHQDIVHRI